MIYRFLLNNQTIDRQTETSAKRFSCSISPDTPVLIFDGKTLIDRGKVNDIWDLPNESYSEKLNRKIVKK